MSTVRTVGITIIGSLVFLCLLYGMANVHYAVPALTPEIEPVHVFIALVPFAILLAASGQLKEIRGPGGIALLLRSEAQRSISLEVPEMELEVQPEVVEEKGGTDRLRALLARNPPTTLSFEIGKRDYYARRAIEEYVRELERYPHFRNIIFVDRDGGFKGLMTAADYRVLLQSDDIVSKIETGEILRDPRVIMDSVEAGSTNRQALSAMDRVGANSLAVVDRRARFVGVVTQDEIVRRMLASVARAV